MPPKPHKNQFILLIDLASDKTFVKNTLNRLFVLKSMQAKGPKEPCNDSFETIFLNSINEKADPLKYYCHIVNGKMHTDILFEVLEEEYKYVNTSRDCDWAAAISRAADLMPTGTNIHTKYIIVISDFKWESTNKDDVMNDCSREMLMKEVVFIVVLNQKVTYNYKKKIEWVHGPGLMNNIVLSLPPNSHIESVCELARQVSGIVTDEDNFINFVMASQCPSPKQPWKQPLEFEGYEFDTLTFKILEANHIGPRAEIVERATTKYYIESMNIAEDDAAEHQAACRLDAEEVDASDISEVIQYYGLNNLVIPNDVEKSFKYDIRRSFRVLGFINPEDLPEIYYGGDALCVKADGSSPRADHFNAFVARVLHSKKYVLVHRVYQANSVGSFSVLLPQSNKKWFLMVPLGDVHERVTLTKPVVEEDEQEKLSKEMLVLRNHLLEQKPLFAPSSSLGIARQIVCEKIRSSIGYTTDTYVKTENVEGMQPNTEDKGIIDTYFNVRGAPQEEDSAAAAGGFITESESEGEGGDNW